MGGGEGGGGGFRFSGEEGKNVTCLFYGLHTTTVWSDSYGLGSSVCGTRVSTLSFLRSGLYLNLSHPPELTALRNNSSHTLKPGIIIGIQHM